MLNLNNNDATRQMIGTCIDFPFQVSSGSPFVQELNCIDCHETGNQIEIATLSLSFVCPSVRSLESEGNRCIVDVK
jgi:hypothetical protein